MIVILFLLLPFIVASAWAYFVNVWAGLAIFVLWVGLVLWRSPDIRP